MAKDNLSAVLYGIEDLRLEQRSIPTPKNDEVLIKVEVVGICGSDVHYYRYGKLRYKEVKKPMLMGHEASGQVVEVGKNVTHLKIGDRVAIEPGIACGSCNFCKQGKYNLCLTMQFCATPPVDGNLTRYYCHSARFCHKLPDNLSFEDGALLEPLAVGVHGCRRGKVTVGSVVLIMGAGPIGLVTLLSAKSFGASKVIILDLVDNRLQVAKQLGADYVLTIEKHMSEDDIVRKIQKILGESPTISFDCSGSEICVRIVLKVTKRGGTAVLIGMGKLEQTVPLSTALFQEIDVIGGYRYCNDYPTAIEFLKTGRINVQPLITHKFKIEDTLQAYETAISGKDNPIKILIYPNKDRYPAIFS
ncbi:hypothetical protein WA026_014371 [Henosepilachna vigintioctopunctata]|uniref:Sorbitol dehydrogenase n=1 Tax=Henosepilachna vigintioctopunctata TaxID=420089 RepID=A0AAW1UDF3_9CUCU